MEAEGFGPRSGTGAGMTMGRRMHASLRDRRRSNSVAFTTMRRTVGALAALACMALPAAASADTFGFTGAEQTYVVPAGVTAVHVEATGAAGAPGSSTGGKGATVSGAVDVTGVSTLYVEVGGVGACNGAAPADPQAGAGGGAADVRTVSVTDGGGSFCGTPFNQSVASLNSRLIVAGAGGGGGVLGFGPARAGGDAGQAAPGGDGAGQAGTDSAGGAGGFSSTEVHSPGAPGTLGAGGMGDGSFGKAGGGGGGLYGGGGGAFVFTPTLVSYGGGGGSSLVPPGGLGPVLTTDPASVEITPCTITGTPGNDQLGGTAGSDTICGLGGIDQINGRDGSDLLFGDAGDDQLVGAGGIDELDGGAGPLDTADYGLRANQEVDVDLASGTVANDGRGFAETIANVERVEGARNRPNNLVGDDGPNKLIGGLGVDTLSGGDGADLLRGDPERVSSGAADSLFGDGGDDVLFPGLGANSVDGGADADTVDYGGFFAASGIVLLFDTNAGTTAGAVSDTLADIEHASGTPRQDVIQIKIFGRASNVKGRADNDNLNTDDADVIDAVNGGPGTDTCSPTDGDKLINCP